MHGGDIYRNQVNIDFSVNVNPFGVPERVMQAIAGSLSEIIRYPDIICQKLKMAIAQHFGLSEDTVLCGNGASEIINAICRWKMPETALVTGPGFSGYTKALMSVNCAIQVFPLQENAQFVPGAELFATIEQKQPQLLFLANPSNPTGVLLDRNYLGKLLEQCQKVHTTVVLDECFIELTGKASAYSMSCPEILQKYDNLIILRALTKSFAIPGIRLGYALCNNAKTAAEIAKQLPEWNVSVPAQAAGVAAFECGKYLVESTAYIQTERKWLTEKLKGSGAVVIPSEANYILFRWPDETLYEQLLQRGILIRDCSDYTGLCKGFYRIAVKKREENELLMQAINELTQK